MSRRAITELRPVVLLLAGVYVEEAQRYLPGWTDAIVAARCKAPPEFVVAVAFAAFGQDVKATEAWRLRQAIVLVARHFDHTVDMQARDEVASAEGEATLAAMQSAGTAPAGGRWDEGWTDDRVAELVGLDPGRIREIRDAIPWVPPHKRAAARWAKFMARYDAATTTGRILRLADEINPATSKPYDVAAIIETLQAAGDMPQHPKAPEYRRDFERLETMIRVTRARIDPETGLERSLRATADAVGMSHQAVANVIGRIDADEMPAEGRPSRLTAEVVARVEAANPQRVDRRSIYRWLIGWVWLRHGEPPHPRTLKGWRATGQEQQRQGVDGLPARFEAAVCRLLAEAPVAGPELPTTEEIAELQGMKGPALADALGVTLEQLDAARKGRRRRPATEPDRRRGTR